MSMHGGLTMKHAEAYRHATEIRKRRPTATTLTLPAQLWDTLREAEDIERKALRMEPLKEGELRLRAPYWGHITLRRGK